MKKQEKAAPILALYQAGEFERRCTVREAECLVGYYVRGLTMAELAGRLGVRPSTVCRNLQRAEEKLGIPSVS